MYSSESLVFRKILQIGAAQGGCNLEPIVLGIKKLCFFLVGEKAAFHQHCGTINIFIDLHFIGDRHSKPPISGIEGLVIAALVLGVKGLWPPG